MVSIDSCSPLAVNSKFQGPFISFVPFNTCLCFNFISRVPKGNSSSNLKSDFIVDDTITSLLSIITSFNWIVTPFLVIEDIISKEISKDLNDLLNCLKKEDREIFIKLYIEEKEIEDISLDTGLKKDVIYNRLSRGRRKMRNIFKLIESRE